MAGWAPRWLTAAVGFILLLGLVHSFSNGPPTKVRAPTGATASPRARRGLQLQRVAAEISGARWRLEFTGFRALRTKICTMGCAIYRGFG
jgi:hypothetical protein